MILTYINRDTFVLASTTSTLLSNRNKVLHINSKAGCYRPHRHRSILEHPELGGIMPHPQRKSSAAKKPPLTHFLCLPVITATSRPQLEASIAVFRDDVASEQPQERASGNGAIHPKAIRPVGVLHCTLGVMSLDQDRLDRAINILQSLDITQLLSNAASTPPGTTFDPQEITPKEPLTRDERPITLQRPVSPPAERNTRATSKPIKIDLKGLVSMHAPEKTSIVYIEPYDSSERLYPLCLALQDIFNREGIIVPDDRKLKLHATLVNTIYAKGKKSQGHGPNAKAPLKIDARALLHKYENFVWAEDVIIDRIAICEMGAKKRMENGEVVGEEYKEVASVPLFAERE
jgi:activating signal cointegrator complex subunit 1